MLSMTSVTIRPLLAARPGPRLLWGLAAVLAVATVVVLASLGRSAWAEREAAATRAEALAAGKQLAVNFVTMNHATFDADSARVLAGATGDFHKEYAESVAKLKPVVVENKTVSKVERAEASLVSADADSAKVIVGVVAPTTNAAATSPEKKTYRLRLDLARVGAEWKVSSLDFVG
jgi:Mce-associated membrane protein